MSDKPGPDEFYSYATRQGSLPISWNDYVGICKGLALAVARYEPELILGIVRGGVYAAALLSHLLRVDLWTIRVTRRQNDRVVSGTPQWLVEPPPAVKDKRVLIVDEICSSGTTLSMAVQETLRRGAGQVKTAVMYAHTQGKEIPDYIGIITDALILNPWDREILVENQFVLHPEYVHALTQQGRAPDAAFEIGVAPYPITKA